MRWRPALTVASVLVVTACEVLSVPREEDGVERQPGPASYLVTTEPEDALDTRVIVLTLHGATDIPVAKVLRADPAEPVFGASLVTMDGRRHVKGLTVPYAPAPLVASVDGVRCDGTIELTEDDEVDATVVIGDDGCDLRLDRRHAMGDHVHPIPEDPAG